ncbi:MAG: type IV pilus biogenesis/stability protein PilW [Burkholderiales bacterium]|nr:type IV pilus biogenesis/stability protein PilW [Burkholderiales bacterium]
MSRAERIALAVLLGAAALAGCQTTSTTTTEPIPDTGSVKGEATDPRNRARIHTELGAAYFERGSVAVALEHLRTAVSADPNYAMAYSMLGLVYAELKENKLAQTNFERALSLAPNDPDINHNFGGFLCRTGREDESIKYFMHAISNPLYAQPWRSYSAAGLCSLAKNRLKEAEEYFQRALFLEADDPTALISMAQIRYRQGNLEESRKLVLRFNRLVNPTAESLWLALRVERKLGERTAEAGYANQLRRRFPNSREYQQLQRGEYD